MQLLVVALLGCCAVVTRSASLSEAQLAVSGSSEEKLSPDEFGIVLSTDDVIREKRSGLGGSGGFFAGIGSAILGKVAQASSGISSGISSGSSDGRNSHQYESVEYGAPVHGYEAENFDIWSFKKAILNTLFQALKAIGGGVIALKGKLIKGGGVVISAKGNIISAKGEAISTLGRHIAASAVLSPPKTSHSYVSYEAPVHVSSGHGAYVGPPPSAYSAHGSYAASPSSDSYGHSGYAAPSDDADHPGLLIVKPAKTEISSYHSGSGSNGQHPALAILSQKSLGLQNLFSKISSASKSNTPGSSGKGPAPQVSFDVAHTVEHVEHKDIGEHQPAASYGLPGLENGASLDHHETHVVHTDDSSKGEDHHDHDGGLDSSAVSHPLENSHLHDNQYHSQNLGFGAEQLSQTNYASVGNGPVLFSMPLEMAVLQSYDHQPSYYSGHSQLQGYNTYNSVQRRQSGSKPTPTTDTVNIIPAIGYSLKNSRVHRI